MALVLSMAPLVAGCGGVVTPGGEGTFVGKLSGSDAEIAIVTSDASVVAYVCGGDRSYTSTTRWFVGDAAEGLHLVKDGWRIDGTLANQTWQGTLTAPSGEELAWSAEAVAPGSEAGLYQAEIDGGKAGVIVHESGAQIDIQGAWREKIGRVLQVTPVMPVHVEAGSLLVSIDRPDGARQITVDRMYNAAP
jgi:hypothetical protein